MTESQDQPPPLSQIEQATISSISEERFSTYLRLFESRSEALEAYWWNVRISGAVWEVIAFTEVAVRNAMHRALTDAFGDRWFRRSELFDDRTLREISTAWRRIGPSHSPDDVPPGKVVGELMFGTWAGMLDAGGKRTEHLASVRMNYEEALWRPSLHHAFPNSSGKRRDMERIVRHAKALRNRVAHHESLIRGVPLPGEKDADGTQRRHSLAEAYANLLELLRTIDSSALDALIQRSRVPGHLSESPHVSR